MVYIYHDLISQKMTSYKDKKKSFNLKYDKISNEDDSKLCDIPGIYQ